MNKPNYISKIRNLIASDKLEEAIDLLTQLVTEDLPIYLDEAIILGMEMNCLSKAIIVGRAHLEKELKIKSEIAYRILKLISLLEKDYLMNHQSSQNYHSIKNSKRA